MCKHSHKDVQKPNSRPSNPVEDRLKHNWLAGILQKAETYILTMCIFVLHGAAPIAVHFHIYRWKYGSWLELAFLPGFGIQTKEGSPSIVTLEQR